MTRRLRPNLPSRIATLFRAVVATGATLLGIGLFAGGGDGSHSPVAAAFGAGSPVGDRFLGLGLLLLLGGPIAALTLAGHTFAARGDRRLVLLVAAELALLALGLALGGVWHR